MIIKNKKKVIEIYINIIIGVIIIICCLVKILYKQRNIKVDIFLMIAGIYMIVVNIYIIHKGIIR